MFAGVGWVSFKEIKRKENENKSSKKVNIFVVAITSILCLVEIIKLFNVLW